MTVPAHLHAAGQALCAIARQRHPHVTSADVRDTDHSHPVHENQPYTPNASRSTTGRVSCVSAP